MRLGHRGVRRALGAPFHGPHYRAALGMVRRYPLRDLPGNARRYLTAGGDYPYVCRLRTPTGPVAPTLYSSHDMLTVNEVFCREDYRCPRDVRVVVDAGANIGISALYFLTRNPAARVYAFEPDPRNAARLRGNLAAYADRFRLESVALDTSDGIASFASDPSGRYGTLGDTSELWWEPTFIEVRVRSINAALTEILERESQIDVLKIDTEGLEEKLVGALADELLPHIRLIVYETDGPAPFHTHRFKHSYACETNRLEARS
jgi:FkbM family methyltransferase